LVVAAVATTTLAQVFLELLAVALVLLMALLHQVVLRPQAHLVVLRLLPVLLTVSVEEIQVALVLAMTAKAQVVVVLEGKDQITQTHLLVQEGQVDLLVFWELHTTSLAEAAEVDTTQETQEIHLLETVVLAEAEAADAMYLEALVLGADLH
jgi:hypothetical protein